MNHCYRIRIKEEEEEKKEDKEERRKRRKKRGVKGERRGRGRGEEEEEEEERRKRRRKRGGKKGGREGGGRGEGGILRHGQSVLYFLSGIFPLFYIISNLLISSAFPVYLQADSDDKIEITSLP